MTRMAALIGAILMLAGAGAAVSRGMAQERDGPSEAVQASAVARGAKAWAEHCGTCHNLRSPGELTDQQWTVSTTHMRVRANLPGDMTDDILAFLQASNDDRPAPSVAPVQPRAVPPAGAGTRIPGDPVKGRRIYEETCVACHGADGKGALEGVPDLTGANGRLAKSDDALLRNMIEGFQSPGSPMPMPPKGGNPGLTDQDMADVLAYIRRTYQ